MWVSIMKGLKHLNTVIKCRMHIYKLYKVKTVNVYRNVCSVQCTMDIVHRYIVLVHSEQNSVLSTQYTVLSTQYTVLSTQ